MSAATDKAQFYIEQLVPELRELEAKNVFTRDEIRQIVRRRQNFEHKLNAPGATAADCVRYLDYEVGLNEMRLLRAKRAGAKVSKHSGPRRLFPLMQRMNRKFPGDLGLWMQYIEYAKRQKAYKRVRQAFADVLRLHPEKVELWMHAARYEFEVQGDLTEAESYIQRGLRISPESKRLYLEFFRLILDSLDRIEEKSRKLGVYKEQQQRLAAAQEDEEDENQIMLPSNEDLAFGGDGDDNDVDPKMVEALQKTRGPQEQIAKVVFDMAVKTFSAEEKLEIAFDMFNTAADYDIPGRGPLLSHIYASLRDADVKNARTRDAAFRMPLIGLHVNTSEFAERLSTVIAELLSSLRGRGVSIRLLHVLSSRWLRRYLGAEGVDEDIARALRLTLSQIASSYLRFVQDRGSKTWMDNLPRPWDDASEMIRLGHLLDDQTVSRRLEESARQRWPDKIESQENTTSFKAATQ